MKKSMEGESSGNNFLNLGNIAIESTVDSL